MFRNVFMIEIINYVITGTVIFRAPARTPMAAIFCIFVYAVNVLKTLRKKNLTRTMLITSG